MNRLLILVGKWATEQRVVAVVLAWLFFVLAPEMVTVLRAVPTSLVFATQPTTTGKIEAIQAQRGSIVVKSSGREFTITAPLLPAIVDDPIRWTSVSDGMPATSLEVLGALGVLGELFRFVLHLLAICHLAKQRGPISKWVSIWGTVLCVLLPSIPWVTRARFQGSVPATAVVQALEINGQRGLKVTPVGHAAFTIPVEELTPIRVGDTISFQRVGDWTAHRRPSLDRFHSVAPLVFLAFVASSLRRRVVRQIMLGEIPCDRDVLNGS